MPLLGYLRSFQPFKLDALGIVTLLGAEQVNNHVGKLVRSRWLEYMPLLGAYVIASDAFTAKQPGFQLYNFSANIYTPDLAGWFTRWLMEQDFETSGSCVEWSINAEPRPLFLDSCIALLLGFVVQAGFIVITILMGDWWGFANAMSMVISTIARAYLVNRNTTWLDRAVVEETRKELQEPKPLTSRKTKTKSNWNKINFDDAKLRDLPEAKTIVVLPDARAVVVFMPNCLVREAFVYNPKPPQSTDETKTAKTWPVRRRQEKRKEGSAPAQLLVYEMVRWIAWLAFGAHVIAIGMSDLVSQLITVVIIVVPTFLTIQGFGCDNAFIGTRLRAETSDIPPEEIRPRRADMYAFLGLSREEEDSLEKWNLAPHRPNIKFWEDYERKKEVYGMVPGLRGIQNYDMRVEEIQAAREAYSKAQTSKSASPQVSAASGVIWRHTSLDAA